VMPASQRHHPAESAIEDEFRLAKKSLLKSLGSKGLYGDVIDKEGKRLFGSKWKGVHTQKDVPMTNGFHIINNDFIGGGQHWVALYVTPRTIFVYDSYGRKTGKLLPLLVRRAGKRRVVDSDHDGEQIGYTSQVCGVLSLVWLMMVSRHGIKKALLI
jgi:hypothetical protein